MIMMVVMMITVITMMTMMTHPTKAKKTKKMQTSIQAAIAVIPSTLGEFVVTMLKMLINTWRRSMLTTMMMTIVIMVLHTLICFGEQSFNDLDGQK